MMINLPLKKYDLAMSQNFKGIGIWVLGYDHGHDELWQLIDENFLIMKKFFMISD